MNAATVIWNQISVPTKMACGARFPRADGDSLLFTVGKTRLTAVKVTLTPRDLYTVQFLKMNAKTLTTKVQTVEDVHVDSLNQTVYSLVNR